MQLVVLSILTAACVTAAQEMSSNESSSFPLRPILAVQQLQVGSAGSEICSLPEGQSVIEVALHHLLQEEFVNNMTCDNAMLGMFEYCPATNCSQIFITSQIFHFPGYYWIRADNGNTIQVHCDFVSEQFPYTTAEIDSNTEDSCPTEQQRRNAQESIHKTINSQLSQISTSFLTCTTQITGLVFHCPANSCSHVFELIHEGFLHLSNYYWLRSPDGDVTEIYCNRSTMQPEYSSCQKLFEFEAAPSGNYIIRISDGAYLEVYCDNETGESEYNSCAHVNLLNLPSGNYTLRTSEGAYSEVYCNNETGQGEYNSCAHAGLFDLPSGTYTIRPSDNNSVTVYCDMNNEECGGGVWTRVASYDYADPSTVCPGDWNQIISPRSCGRSNSDTGSCSSALFSTSGIQFSSVCGQVIAIQYGIPGAFYPQHVSSQSIDNYYVEGVSITHGSPREHIWTFAGYRSDDYQLTSFLCPCSQPSLSVSFPPSFVGNNYFCDTGASTCCPYVYHHDDPLWDGQGCGGTSTCCSFNNPPWFSTALPETITDDIEMRICGFQPTTNEDTSIVTLDLFIQ